jgi:hypothetical protein
MNLPRAFCLPILFVAAVATGCLHSTLSSIPPEGDSTSVTDGSGGGEESSSGPAADDDDDSSPSSPVDDDHSSPGDGSDNTVPDENAESHYSGPSSLSLCSAAGRVRGNGLTATTCLAPWRIGTGVTSSASLLIQVGPAYRIDPEGTP